MRLESLPGVDDSFFKRPSECSYISDGRQGGTVIYLNQAQSFPQLLTQPDLLPGKKKLLSGEIKESLPKVKLY